VYCYLQINLRKFRMFLLLPYVVSHCIFYLSLHFPLDDTTRSFKDAPLHFTVNNPPVVFLQVARVKQVSKSVAFSEPVADDLVRIVLQAPKPTAVTGYGYLPSPSVSAYQPPALFPTRASPV